MKLVREILDEKFTDVGTDPVKDMGIGQDALDKKLIEETDWAIPDEKIKRIYDIVEVIHNYNGYPILILQIKKHSPEEQRNLPPYRAISIIGVFGTYQNTRRQALKNLTDSIDREIEKERESHDIWRRSQGLPPLKKLHEKFSEDTDPIKDMGIGLYKGWRQKYDKKPVLTYTFYLKDLYENKRQYKFSLCYENRYKRNGVLEDAIYFGEEKLIQGWDAYGGSKLHLRNMQAKPEEFFGGPDEATFWNDSKVFDKTFIDIVSTRETATISRMINEISEDWFDEPQFTNMVKKWLNTAVFMNGGEVKVDHVKMRIR